MKTLLPLGSGEVMPAIVAGYEITDSAMTAETRSLGPEWLFEVEQQAGGMAMSYPTLVGAVMPLRHNRSRALKDPSDLLTCFDAMAEVPDRRLLAKRFSKMAELCCTRGGAYSDEQLRVITSFVARYFALPDWTCGLEALVRAAPSAGIRQVFGWKTIAPTECAGVGQDFGHPDRTWKSSSVFSGRHAAFLRTFGVALGNSTPRLFLIWENSD